MNYILNEIVADKTKYIVNTRFPEPTDAHRMRKDVLLKGEFKWQGEYIINLKGSENNI